MKIFYLLSIFALALLPATVSGQAELRQKGDTLNVSTNGREVIMIKNNGYNSLFLRIGGFTIDLEGMDKKTNSSTNASVTTNKKVVVKSKKKEYYVFGNFQLGFIGLTAPDYSMYPDRTMNFMELDNLKSISFSFTFSANFPLTYCGTLWMSLGIRPRWDNYVFDNPITIVKSGGMVHPVELTEMRRLKKSKLTTFSVDVPLMFEVKPVKKISINAGVYGGLTLRDHTKVKFPKSKDRGDFGVNFFNAGLILQVKYKGLGVFANYSLTPLFKDSAGPRTNPFTIGILW